MNETTYTLVIDTGSNIQDLDGGYTEEAAKFAMRDKYIEWMGDFEGTRDEWDAMIDTCSIYAVSEDEDEYELWLTDEEMPLGWKPVAELPAEILQYMTFKD